MNGWLNARARRRGAQTWLRAAARRRMRVRGDDELGGPAVVFAPHPDDETLACGGTIVKKTRAGATVALVVMTDGRGSHGVLMDGERIKEIRTREALEAARLLGIPEHGVEFVGFRDRELSQNRGEAISEVEVLLRRHRPAEVYVPYLHDGPADHVETRRAVLAAASAAPGVRRVYEYPVWFWFHWPWVPYPLDNRRDVGRVAVDNVLAAVRAIRDFNSCVYVGDVLDQKRRALEAYASQMTRLVDDPAWARLQDVADGEFLDCFFQDYEVFWERRIGGNPA